MSKVLKGRQIAERLSKDYSHICLIDGADTKVQVLSSGIPSLDVATGVGGYPSGRFVILHGAESCGKSTVALHAVAECQRRNGIAVYLDFECKLDKAYAQSIGVDLESLILAEPPYIENGFQLLEETAGMIRAEDAGCPILFVWDSLNFASSKRTADGDYDAAGYPPEARIYSIGFAKFMSKLKNSHAILIGISQVRMKVEGGYNTGSRQRIGVGKATPHAASMILRFKTRPRGTVKTGREGEDIEIVVSKNQVAAPWKTARFPLVYGSGINKPISLLNAAIDLGMVIKGGGWYTVSAGKERYKIQGELGMVRFAEEEPKAYKAMEKAIYKAIGKR